MWTVTINIFCEKKLYYLFRSILYFYCLPHHHHQTSLPGRIGPLRRLKRKNSDVFNKRFSITLIRSSQDVTESDVMSYDVRPENSYVVNLEIRGGCYVCIHIPHPTHTPGHFHNFVGSSSWVQPSLYVLYKYFEIKYFKAKN